MKNIHIYQKISEYMGGRKCLRNMSNQSHEAYALKNIQKVLSTRK
jgi:hypothetical protein